MSGQDTFWSIVIEARCYFGYYGKTKHFFIINGKWVPDELLGLVKPILLMPNLQMADSLFLVFLYTFCRCNL